MRLALFVTTFAVAVIGAAQQEAVAPAKRKGLPLKPERTIEFTTDEGSWISLDVSPDGRAMVFELLGDLYTLPIEGGEARRVTSGMAFDNQPRYSPDGKRIVFLSDRDGAENVWIASADGSDPRQVSREQKDTYTSPSWTPDGEYILVHRRSFGAFSGELWMYHARGGAGVQVTRMRPTPTATPQQFHISSGAVASRDGRYFYYARRRPSFPGPGVNPSLPSWQIARRDRTTGDEDFITSAPGGAFRPTLSPDGTKLVYGTRHDAETALRVRDLVTGEDRWLKHPVQRDDLESGASRDLLPGLAFMLDGKEIVASWGGKIHRMNLATRESRVIPFTAKVSQEIGPLLNFPARVDDGPVRARLIQGAGQSPDGKRLAFSALTHIYTMDLPGGKPVRATAANAREFQPAWSPDGQWLAYVTWSTEGGHIWKARPGAAPVQLTKVPAYYRDPVWSPDGSRIVAIRAPRSNRVELPDEWGRVSPGLDVVWIAAEGGDVNVAVPARGAGRPHFTTDKDRIYVYSGQGLQSFRFDGTDRRTHLKVVGKGSGAEPEAADEIRLGPDGTRALALFRGQLYAILVPRIGGEAPTVNVSSASTPVKRITNLGLDAFAWADSGATITWSVGSTFFRRPLATLSFDPEVKPEEEGKTLEILAEEKHRALEEENKLVQAFDVSIERARHKPAGSIVLRGAKVITMRGEEIIPDADIVATDNRIAAVGRRGSVSVPKGATIFDVKGTTIMPGLVDVHAHYTEVRRDVLDTEYWGFLANLAYGVTTGRDPQTSTNDVFAYQDLVEVGEILGPRAFNTGPGIGYWNTDLQSAPEAKSAVSRYLQHYRTNTIKSYLVGNRRQRQWMVEASKAHRVMPTTEGAADLKLDLTHVIDGFSGNEHSLGTTPLYKDVAELIARAGLFYTPTFVVNYGGPIAEHYFFLHTEVHDDPKVRRFIPHNILDRRTKRRPWYREEEFVHPRIAADAAKVIRAGGRVCIGGHGQLQGIQCHWEMWALASGGLTPMETIRAATIHGAEAIGYAQDLGSIEAGKFADLIVMAKDPLENIRNTNTVKYVMKNGELFEGETLNQVWPQKKQLAPLWWWNEKP